MSSKNYIITLEANNKEILAKHELYKIEFLKIPKYEELIIKETKEIIRKKDNEIMKKEKHIKM